MSWQKTSHVSNPTKIKVIGLGGGGCNAITRMIREQIRGVEFIAMNADVQHLAATEAALRVQLGERTTHGLGAGGDHILGRKAAEESRNEIKEVVTGADMVFVMAGMGGGTGTGSAPLVAEIAKQSGALTIAMVTKPFSFEGTHRTEIFALESETGGPGADLAKFEEDGMEPGRKLREVFSHKSQIRSEPSR